MDILFSRLTSDLLKLRRLTVPRVAAFGAACLCLAPLVSRSATFSAVLDRSTITLGETATLSLTFAGGAPENPPAPPDIPNLQIRYVGPSSQFSYINGQVSSTVTHNFIVAPTLPGDFTIPAFTAQVGGEKLATQPITLKVLKPGAPSPDAVNSGLELALLKLVVPKKEVYLGEVITAELQLCLRQEVQNIENAHLTALPAEGFNVSQPVQGNNRRAQIGGATYTVIPLSMTLRPLKTGNLTIGPVTFSVVLDLPSSRRRRDPIPELGLGGLFGPPVERKQVTLATDTETLTSLPLPGENVPVGNYTMTMTAGPTNVAMGDPITVRLQISGRGALDALTLPDQPAWHDFKTYPPTAKIETTDALGAQGTKTFEQVIVPQSADIKELPPLSFSFFDPDQKAYRTLTQPPVKLIVRPATSVVAPTVVATGRSAQDSPPPAEDIVPNKQHWSTVAQLGPPLVQQPWFLALQGVPVLAWVSALVWRKRADQLANNPRLRRQRLVAIIIRNGLVQLRQLAAARKSDEFFAALFRLLQEQLGERLDLPASAITEAVIEEQLRPRRAPETILGPLHDLFQTCNLARYAPIKTSQELAAIIPKFETVLGELQKLKL